MGLTPWGNGMQKTPVPIMEGIPVVQIASGADHFVCLTTEGQVYTCGCAEQGQLGRVAELFSDQGGRRGKDYLLTPQPVSLSKGGQKPIVVDSIWTGSYATFVRARDSDLIYVFGLNNYNQLGKFFLNDCAEFHPFTTSHCRITQREYAVPSGSICRLQRKQVAKHLLWPTSHRCFGY